MSHYRCLQGWSEQFQDAAVVYFVFVVIKHQRWSRPVLQVVRAKASPEIKLALRWLPRVFPAVRSLIRLLPFLRKPRRQPETAWCTREGTPPWGNEPVWILSVCTDQWRISESAEGLGWFLVVAGATPPGRVRDRRMGSRILYLTSISNSSYAWERKHSSIWCFTFFQKPISTLESSLRSPTKTCPRPISGSFNLKCEVLCLHLGRDRKTRKEALSSCITHQQINIIINWGRQTFRNAKYRCPSGCKRASNWRMG